MSARGRRLELSGRLYGLGGQTRPGRDSQDGGCPGRAGPEGPGRSRSQAEGPGRAPACLHSRPRRGRDGGRPPVQGRAAFRRRRAALLRAQGVHLRPGRGFPPHQYGRSPDRRGGAPGPGHQRPAVVEHRQVGPGIRQRRERGRGRQGRRPSGGRGGQPARDPRADLQRRQLPDLRKSEPGHPGQRHPQRARALHRGRRHQQCRQYQL